MKWTTQNRFYLIFSFVLFSSSSSNRDDVSSLLCLIFCLITYVRWQSVPEVYRYDQHKYRASYNNGGTAVRFSPSTPKRLVPQASPLGCEYWLVIMYVCMYQYVCLYVHLYVHFCRHVYLYVYHWVISLYDLHSHVYLNVLLNLCLSMHYPMSVSCVCLLKR